MKTHNKLIIPIRKNHFEKKLKSKWLILTQKFSGGFTVPKI